MDSENKINLICPLCKEELNIGFRDCRCKCECGWSADISIKPHDQNKSVKLVKYIMEICDNEIEFKKQLYLAVLKDENTFYYNEINDAERKLDYLYDYAEFDHNKPRITFNGNLKGYKQVVYFTKLEDHEKKELLIKKEMYLAMKKSFDQAKNKVLDKINNVEKEMEKIINEN